MKINKLNIQYLFFLLLPIFSISSILQPQKTHHNHQTKHIRLSQKTPKKDELVMPIGQPIEPLPPIPALPAIPALPPMEPIPSPHLTDEYQMRMPAQNQYYRNLMSAGGYLPLGMNFPYMNSYPMTMPIIDSNKGSTTVTNRKLKKKTSHH